MADGKVQCAQCKEWFPSVIARNFHKTITGHWIVRPKK